MKLMERMKQKRMGNKGFSLVELIIVIAIMAILVGLVGTQVIPYLTRARGSADREVLSAYATAATSAYALNPEETYPAGAISVFGTSAGTAGPAGFMATLEEMAGYDDISDITLQSGTATDILITFDFTNHTVTVSFAGDAGVTAVQAVESTL